jgi:putative sterol carrier protein
MDIAQIIIQIQSQASAVDPIGGSIKFILDDQVLIIDGSGNSNIVSQEDRVADCTISTSLETLMKMKSGDLNPMMAAMSGKVKISGDMGLAMKLQSLI